MSGGREFQTFTVAGGGDEDGSVLRMALWCTRRGLSAVLAVCCLLYVTAMFSLSGSRHVRPVVSNSAVHNSGKLRRVNRAFAQPPPDAPTTLQARTTVTQMERRAVLVLSQLRRDAEVVGTIFSQQENIFFVPEHLWSFMYPDPFFSNSLPDTKMALFSENKSFLNETERSRKWTALTVTLRALFRCDFDTIFNQRDRESGDEFGGGVPPSVAKDMFCREIQKSATLRDGFSCHGSPDEIVRRMTSLCVAKATVAVMMTGITHVRNLQALVEDESLKLKVIEVVHDPRAMLVSWMSAVPRRRAGDADRRGFFDTRGGLTLTATEMSRMCVAMVTNLQYWAGMRSSDRPFRANYSVLRYEDLRANPRSVSDNILSFLGQHPATGEAALRRTVARIERKIEDLKDGNGDWRRNLTVAGATKIQGRCSEAIRKFGYELVKSERDLTNNSTSLIGTLPTEVPGVVRNSSGLVFSSALRGNETLLLIQKPKVRTVVHYRLRVRKNETQ
ncbi:PREDICTED: carbohydrate sulfotransferase 1-like [Branchiostoma belcheri]|uniref:Sulfotransferase n=1 Tax=Branchiostoma belcheri TaxID=7741 RepID=A0A6P4XW76_BRABE|nr:PREDICTED: carbohydrate sulfotransferase 1-like [Branchiostoma belcheri]